ncbi:tolloid-like protein 2 [Acanthaster planci]|uniref:Tolloid-like protein 2 n=1 Tax=Acanthaster planci TaxID=133434 RepID=A0A8B7Z859_ACAPL|nr:tolloid-like protein 2 [Acanthaster planci]
MGKISSLVVLLLAVFIIGAGNALAKERPKEKPGDVLEDGEKAPKDAPLRENHAINKTIYLGVGKSRTISSPNYPRKYPNNQDCIWYLQTEKGSRIRITFKDFQTQKYYDRLKGGDGSDVTKLKLFDATGIFKPRDQVSNGNTMWLRFTSDFRFTKKGFRLVARSFSSSDERTYLSDKVRSF